MTLAQDETVVTWTEPDPIPVRGTLVVLPGRGESPGVYERFGRRLAADAYRVHVITAPSDDQETARAQLTAVFADADPAKPRVLVGSDAGAAYAVHLASEKALANVDAVVLAGLPVESAAAESRGWDDELEARTSCPTHRGKISQAGVRPGELFTELPANWFGDATVDLPVFGVHGRNDVVSVLKQAREWYAAQPDAELISIVDAPHDVLNDQTHRTVAASIVLFLERLRAGKTLAITEQESPR